MSLGEIAGVGLERLANVEHRARVYGPRPGVPNGSANDPANLFVVDPREHPFGVGAGLPEPFDIEPSRRTDAVLPRHRLCRPIKPAFRRPWSTSSATARSSMDTTPGDLTSMALAQPSLWWTQRNPWTVVTYLQSLTGAGAEGEPNLR